MMPNQDEVIYNDKSSQFRAQLRAMMLKNLTYQSRQRFTTCCQIFVPVILVVLIGVFQVKSKDMFGDGGGSFINSGPSNSYWNSMLDSYTWGYLIKPSANKGGSELGTLSPFGSPNNTGVLGNFVQDLFVVSPYQRDGVQSVNNTWVPFLTETSLTPKQLLDQFYDVAAAAVINGSFSPDLPMFNLIFSDFSLEKMNAEFLIQYSNGDSGYGQAYSNYGQQDKYSIVTGITSQIHASMIESTMQKTNATAEFSINMGYRSFSFYQTYGSVDGTIAFFGFFFVSCALVLMLPLFVQILVLEKQERLLEMMKIMGLKMNTYWIMNWIFFFAINMISVLFAVIVGLACGVVMFTKINPLFWIALYLLWVNAQIAFSFFLSTLFQRTKVAFFVTNFLTVLCAIGGVMLNGFYFRSEMVAPFWYMFIPPLAFIRGQYVICASLFEPAQKPISFSNLGPSNEILINFGYLIGEIVIYTLLAIYLDLVLPREYGVNYSPLFPIQWIIQRFKNSSKNQDIQEYEFDEEEGEDCRAERARVHNMNLPNHNNNNNNHHHHESHIEDGYSSARLMVRVVDAHRRFEGKKIKIALKKMCLGIPEGECFGLLGPNGAGKSTLIHILVGLVKPTSGTAFINDLDITDSMYKIHQIIGFCPQHDITWKDLTVEEHLLFYCRMRGNVPRQFEGHAVMEAISKVGLSDSGKKRVSQLSGGMKRRLSIAISLVGNPKFILLDEPTTGLDPETRREIWTIIQQQKVGRSILLTTHNMEEADALATRIGIMSQGQLVCVGNQLNLKNRFGKGYHLSVTPEPDHQESVKSFIYSICPGAVLESTFSRTMSFQINKSEMNLSQLVEAIKKNKSVHHIQEWGVNQTSLEEVFLKIIQEDESAE